MKLVYLWLILATTWKLWFQMNYDYFFQSEAQTKTQGIKSVFCLDFQLIFSELNIWQIRGQIFLLVLKAVVFIKSEFDSTFTSFSKELFFSAL